MAGIIKGLVSDGTLPTTAKQDLAADLTNGASSVGQAVSAKFASKTELTNYATLADLDNIAGGGPSGDIYQTFDGYQMVSGPGITGSGDSLTAGAGGEGTSWPSAVQDILNSVYTTPGTVTNLGVGGETPATIAGRTALGTPWLATVAGGQIPSSGGVTVTLVSSDGSAVAPLVQGSAGINPVQIAGVTGSLSLASGTYTFTRSTTGSAVTVAQPAEVTTKAQRERQSDIFVMWWGQNGEQDADKIITQQSAAIKRFRAFQKRWIVLGLSTGSGASREVMDNKFQNAYGDRFLNIREYLSTFAALQAEGITPTTADTDAIAIGAVPPSFLSDGVHMNAAGYRRIGRAVYEKLRALGWNDQWGVKGDDPGEEVTPVFADYFERASTNIVGSSTDSGGLTWVSIGSGTAPITNGAATINATSDLLVYVAAAQSNGVLTFDVKTVGAGGSGSGMLFRFVDLNNYWFLRPNTGVWQLLKRVAGTMAVVDADLGPATDGDSVAVALDGGSITINVNGVEQHVSTSVDHQAGGGYGLRGGTSGAVAIDAIRLDPLA